MFVDVDEESFSDLRHLLDYAQIVLPLPFVTTELWQKHNVGPSEVAILHALFGLSAFLFYALMEYRRQDLTDLALILSIISSAVVGLLYQNYFATLAAAVVAAAYFGVKRKETCGDTKPQMIFNISMAVFSIASLAAFEPKDWIPAI
ncbi:hypothetical protein NQ314_012182 [Rhamnusium bicolor]|uniref:Uncharacterized protein n=1 Tax=Rhamnusium bicolor TaxID=1586634 RepID=A0AAV8XCJ7_9CUCU|nr:hypothetical protein NQ314_012182 [Rhamnusium bicolor]